jgi:hypothetical protein
VVLIPTPTGATEEYDGTSWTTSNPLNTARNGLSGAGTQSSALAFGGGPSPDIKTETELYDGTSWTSNPTGLNTARTGAGAAGTQQLQH